MKAKRWIVIGTVACAAAVLTALAVPAAERTFRTTASVGSVFQIPNPLNTNVFRPCLLKNAKFLLRNSGQSLRGHRPLLRFRTTIRLPQKNPSVVTATDFLWPRGQR